MDGNAFVDASDEQAGVGAAFEAAAAAYALVAALSAVQLARNCVCYRPWTVQKMLHLLLFLGTLGASDGFAPDAGTRLTACEQYARCSYSWRDSTGATCCRAR
jgi:hypothetical protein